MTGLPNAPSHCELRRLVVIFTATAVTGAETHAPARERRRGPVVRRNVAGQSLRLRRRNSQVRHSGPVHRTPDAAGCLGVLNELRHIGESFRVTLRHGDRDAGLLKSSIDDVRAGEFRDEWRQRITSECEGIRLTRAPINAPITAGIRTEHEIALGLAEHFVAGAPGEENRRFVEAYRKKYNRTPDNRRQLPRPPFRRSKVEDWDHSSFPLNWGKSTSAALRGVGANEVIEQGGSWLALIAPMSPVGRCCSLIPGLSVKLSTTILAGPTVLSAVGACPPHDGVR